tara:strand:- start:2057 stop:2557 length:501 start_codon:yes stop_codon:yes gene_type:complete
MDKQTFIDKIKLLFSETEEVKAAEDCACKGEKDCECDKLEHEMAEEEPEVAAHDKEECKCEEGDEDCKCDEEPKEEVLEPELAEEEEVKEDEPKEDEMEKRLEALEKALANISESMSAIDSLSKAVSDLANSPSEGEVKLSKASWKSVKNVSAREERVIAFSKRSK